VRSLGARELRRVQVKCIWAWLPERTGDISYGHGGGASDVMGRVPRVEEVVALTRQTLAPPPASPAIPEVTDIPPSLWPARPACGAAARGACGLLSTTRGPS